MRVLNFGSMNIDTVFSASHAVLAGESLAVSNPEIHAGGKGLNQSIAAARAGAKVFHAGCAGNDGEFLLRFLEENGVDHQYFVCTHSGHGLQNDNAVYRQWMETVEAYLDRYIPVA